MATSRFRVVYHDSRYRDDEYFVDGKPVSKARYRRESRKHAKKQRQGVPMLGGNTSEAWPLKSDALAVHPKDIKKAMEFDRKHGIASEYDPKDGRAILKDRAQRRDMMKAHRMHDNEGGYGDDHHTPSEAKPAIDPRTVAACKFLDTLSFKGIK